MSDTRPDGALTSMADAIMRTQLGCDLPLDYRAEIVRLLGLFPWTSWARDEGDRLERDPEWYAIDVAPDLLLEADPEIVELVAEWYGLRVMNREIHRHEDDRPSRYESYVRRMRITEKDLERGYRHDPPSAIEEVERDERNGKAEEIR